MLLLVWGFAGFAQEWAPIGAKWHYNLNDADLFGIPGTSFSVFESTGDTLFEGVNCRKILKSHSYSSYACRPLEEYTYYSNDSVYFYDNNFPGFYLLYDFAALPGEFWYYQYPGWCGSTDIDSVKVTVDSTDVVVINSYSLHRLFVHYDSLNFEADSSISAWTWFDHNSVIIEFIGDLTNMFYSSTWDEMAFDATLPGGLRCYDDTIIGQFETGIVDSCDYVNLLATHETEAPQLKIFPNPIAEMLFVEGAFEDFSIFSIEGKTVNCSSTMTDDLTAIDVSHLESGVYFICLRTNDGFGQRSVFVRE